ncbi:MULTISPECIES: competence type IV pilus assembly protein ComGB [Lactococcus]|uniref:competence type IV pilus assembly protein ComGB n=1 Tax=Lactococcus TaxID=1357 RepID=UPI0023008FED|nr:MULTISPECIES: competence type IV pilus assembly protein ComGB [Lactococcus]
MDLSHLLQLHTKKLSLARQIKLIQLMNNLFTSGFHIGEIIDFLERSGLTEKQFTSQMRRGLLRGKSLSGILDDLKFSGDVVTQLSLAESHGNIELTLGLVEQNLTRVLNIRRKLIQVATYPLILLVFLAFIMLGLKNYLLPQLEENSSLAVKIIQNLPLLFLSSILISVIFFLICKLYFRKKTALENMRVLVKLPIIGSFVQLYLTAYFSREWGNLLAQAVDLRQICFIMQEQKSRIFKEFGLDLLYSLDSGKKFEEALRVHPIFTKELSLIVEYGELKSKLGQELIVFSEESWSRFFERIERAMQLIQPLVFLIVAVLIILIYVAMLLPIYNNMGSMM